MKFDTPAGANAIDRLKVIGRPTDRIDGPAKTTGTARYAYERHDQVADPAYGYIVGSAIAKGRVTRIDTAAARAAPGVRAIVTHENAGKLGKGQYTTARLLGGPVVEHYHQALAIVVADTFEQARAAAALVRIDYAREKGQHDLAVALKTAPLKGDSSGEGSSAPPVLRVGRFEEAFAAAPVKLDQTYTTPGQSHAMMEPHATTASWDGDKLTLHTANQMIAWSKADLAKIMGIPAANIRLDAPYVGGGFGAKLWIRADAVLAALGARAAGRPVKVALARPFIFNNTTHRSATVQRIRLGAARDGHLTAIAHESGSGNLPGGEPETASSQTKILYAAANRLTSMRLATVDLPEASAMRAPGEAPGLMALEIAMDELAEKLGMDPVQLRIINDTQVDPAKPERPFSQRHLVECLTTGAARFGWARRAAAPGQVRDGGWLVGMGMAAGIRDNLLMKSGAKVRVDPDGGVTVLTDMTDIGTGTYTILAQTAAEVLELPLAKVRVVLGDSDHPASAGSGGQWGANNSAAGVYAACVKLRETVAAKLGPDAKLKDAAGLSVEDQIEYGDLDKRFQQSTFAAHFCEVGVDAWTGEIRLRRMLAVCDAGRILNPKAARSQVIGAMTMGAGAALMEELAVDRRFGFFVNHDLAGYEVPVHLDIPHQEVVFLDHPDDKSSPLKAKGVGELGICGVGAAIANAVYNATGVRVRDYPVTLDKHLAHLPAVA